MQGRPSGRQYSPSPERGYRRDKSGKDDGGQLSTSETKTVNLLMHLSDMLK